MLVLFKKSLPLQLVLAIVLALILEPWMEVKTLSFFYTLSCAFKDLLMMVIPFVVFGYLMSSLVSFDKRALGMIFGILGLATLSNALCVFVAYGLGATFLPWLSFEPFQIAETTSDGVTALWTIPWTSPLTPGIAMALALFLGVGAIFTHYTPLKKLARRVRDDSTTVLKKVFIPLLPFYVFGFMLRLQYEGTFELLVKGYGQVFLLTLLIMILYVIFWYGVAAQFRWKHFKNMLVCMFPAGITAFTTMSSAATLPVTLEGTEKMLKERTYADFVIPLTANNHTVGDGLSIALSVLSLMWMSQNTLPTFESYALFTLFYCLARFSTAGVPGGGILVMLPIIQEYMGMSPGLLSLLTTLYVLQDPIITSVNVLGNGVFAFMTASLFQRKKEAALSQTET